MKKVLLAISVVVLIILGLVLNQIYFSGITGNAVQNYGIPQEEIDCMMPCMQEYCNDLTDSSCTSQYSSTCMESCSIEEHVAATSEEACVEDCIYADCEMYDFDCQDSMRPSCDEQCGMIKAPSMEGMSEEQICITNCVNAIEPGLICGASALGETGGEVCQQCASQCESLYAGPCLDEIKLEEVKAACNTCEHCYGSPVMGDSGEGWECIVSVECKDASSEFGDEAETGEGVIGNTISGIIDFFQGLFE